MSDDCFQSLPVICRAETIPGAGGVQQLSDDYRPVNDVFDMLCTRKVCRAYSVCEHELTTLVMCCDTDKSARYRHAEYLHGQNVGCSWKLGW